MTLMPLSPALMRPANASWLAARLRLTRYCYAPNNQVHSRAAWPFRMLFTRALSRPHLRTSALSAPVRFAEAFAQAAAEADLIIEVGPGHGLTRLAGEMAGGPVIALDAGSR